MPVDNRSFSDIEIPAPGTFQIDPAHSRLGFAVRHMMVAKVRGHIANPTGTILIAEDPLMSSVTVEADWANVATANDTRDQHLKTGDFLDASGPSGIRFESTAVRHLVDAAFEVDGNLTIGEITKPITLGVELEGLGLDQKGNTRVGFSATTSLNREDYGITYNTLLEAGGLAIGKQVQIEIDVEAVAAG